MKDDITPQGALFNKLINLPVHVHFDQSDSSSDGGALLLKALDKSLGLTQRVRECLRDKRNSLSIAHSYHDLLRQRIYGICCGYEDCDDTARTLVRGMKPNVTKSCVKRYSPLFASDQM